MRSKIIAVCLTLATLVSVPAFAAPGRPGPARAEHGQKGEKPNFPMPAAAFKARIEAHQSRARAHMEERAKKATPAEAKQIRERFDAITAKVNAEVAKATADGTVTKEEAQAVRAAAPRREGKRPNK